MVTSQSGRGRWLHQSWSRGDGYYRAIAKEMVYIRAGAGEMVTLVPELGRWLHPNWSRGDEYISGGAGEMVTLVPELGRW